MCGGISYRTKDIPLKEFKKYYSLKQIEIFRKKGNWESFFWAPIPLLPMEINNQIELKKWGNREPKIDLPKTGWIQEESFDKGKWNYLKPQLVKIPALRGFEKGIWFEIKSGYLKGVIVTSDNQERIYMMTKPADEQYLKLTKHARQPVETK